MINIRGFVFFVFLFSIFSLSAAKVELQHVEPPFWWVGMNDQKLQLLVHGDDISLSNPKIDYNGVTLEKVIKTDNPNFLFLDLRISPDCKAGSFDIDFLNKKGKKVANYSYQLFERQPNSANRKGFDQSDFVYLLMPDRFANGDSENDNVKNLLEKSDRNNPDGRHGGDIQGIENNLDYISDLGATAIWINPLLENNQAKYSYHGYAISDFYKVDGRYGSNEDYKNLVKKAHSKDLKVVQDMVFNHCGIAHWWLDDLPDSSWFNQWPEFTRSNFRASTICDVHASAADKNRMTKGWFDTNMPDLNQSNPLVANYLIQNSIWWTEYLGLDGIRQDTYMYGDKYAMKNWCERMKLEYPNFNIVGELWTEKEGIQKYWMTGAANSDGYDSELMMLTDFPLHVAILKSFNGEKGWRVGVEQIYYALAQDYLYEKPENNMVFLDNHDRTRFYSAVGENMDKYKQGVAFLLTVRGIPQWYYGTELAMTGEEHHGHGAIRKDFPGGWDGDKVNVFENIGVDKTQKEALNFVKTLALWRKNKSVIHYGKMMHFVPENNVYVYFRYNNQESVMVVLNYNDKNVSLNTERFAERLDGFNSATDVISGEKISNLNSLDIPANGVLVVELSKM